ncbi:hypothetical protein AMECASPLE_012920 [Ameca splendens]|uniref:Ig-like domain-containing protein n=1 Tax=Ameca splendens TaxID=208324 RepID=A0ABV0YNP1_9TELE
METGLRVREQLDCLEGGQMGARVGVSRVCLVDGSERERGAKEMPTGVLCLEDLRLKSLKLVLEPGNELEQDPGSWHKSCHLGFKQSKQQAAETESQILPLEAHQQNAKSVRSSNQSKSSGAQNDMVCKSYDIHAIQTCPTNPCQPSLSVPPKIYDISSDITVNEGSNVSLICTATGKPEPTIAWRHITPLADSPFFGVRSSRCNCWKVENMSTWQV